MLKNDFNDTLPKNIPIFASSLFDMIVIVGIDKDILRLSHSESPHQKKRATHDMSVCV